MDISILIATKRPFNLFLKKLLDSIFQCNTDYKYEILVCGNYKNFFHENIKFFEDEKNDGSVSAYNFLLKQSKGKYIITLPDGVIVPKNFFDIVEELKELEKQNQKLIVTSFTSGIGTHAYTPEWAGTNCQILRFPCFSRNSLKKFFGDVIFNPSFKHHYCDNWLGSFCHLFGEVRKESDNVCLIDIPHQNFTRSDEYDKIIYKQLIFLFETNRRYDIKINLEEKNEY